MFKSNSLLPILQEIRSGKIKNIVFLSGAGISVPSGIPDFRSANGLYKTLKPELLTASARTIEAIREEPTLVVDYSLFSVNQFPYLEVRRNLILGLAEKKWKPTLGHALIRLFHQHQQLRRVYTQNIDGIDYQLGLLDTSTSSSSSSYSSSLPLDGKDSSLAETALTEGGGGEEEKGSGVGLIINVHGTIHKIECEQCKDTSYTMEEFCQQLKTKIKNIYDPNDEMAPKESSKIYCKKCHQPQVKPATVMFGRSYSEEVWTAVGQDFPDQVDLLIVIGTSLQVSPANSFVRMISSSTPVIVINNERVGEEMGFDFGELTECKENDYKEFTQHPESFRSKDAIILGDGDEGSLYLIQQLGWLSEVIAFQDILCPNSQQLLSSVATRK